MLNINTNIKDFILKLLRKFFFDWSKLGGGMPLTAEEMRKRQTAILIERRRQLQERLHASTASTAAFETPAAAASPVMSTRDLDRLERAINMLRQIVVLIMFSIAILALRRILLELEDDEPEELWKKDHSGVYRDGISGPSTMKNEAWYNLFNFYSRVWTFSTIALHRWLLCSTVLLRFFFC